MKNTLSNLLAGRMPLKNQIISSDKDFTVEVCLNERSKREAYSVRYQAYVQAGLISENEEELLYDAYDTMPNVRIFLVWHCGKPVATVRSCIYSDRYNWMPTEAVLHFQKDLSARLGTGTRLLESNRFAVVPDFQGRQSLFARLLLFRIHGLNAAVHDCKYLITSVQANHQAFYRRFLGLEPVSEQTLKHEWIEAEVSLLFNRVDRCLESILQRGMPDYDQDDIMHFAMCASLPLIDGHCKVA